MGIAPEFAHGTIRFGIGKYNTKEEIDYVLDSVVEVVNKLRAISPLWNAYKEGK
jgi:cysteine desulfurase